MDAIFIADGSPLTAEQYLQLHAEERAWRASNRRSAFRAWGALAGILAIALGFVALAVRAERAEERAYTARESYYAEMGQYPTPTELVDLLGG